MKILFIHGLASSGAYKMASSLRILLRPCEVVAPDVPIDPDEALRMLLGLCAGGFWAQKLRGERKILVNPDFHVSRLLRTKLGENEYLSPRADGAETFLIDEDICSRYEALERTQFDSLPSGEQGLTRGMFALQDELVHCGDEFERHYPGRGTYYPGGHLPTFPELKKYLLPLV